ncbi:MAG: nuclear transport factor 2 family protein [Chthoniobacterales bacterium]
MKHPRLLTIIAIALPVIAFAQTKDATKPDAESEKAVIKVEQDMSAALTKPDAAVAESMLADSFFATNPDGTTETKAQFVADMKSGDLKLVSNNLKDMKVQIATADMAVVTYGSNDKGSYKGKDISGEYRWIDVLMKRDGKWQFVVSQGTTVEKAKP